jgi:hypothetical protein
VKKLIRWLLIAVVVVWVMKDPAGAAALARQGVAVIESAAHALSTLASGLSR